MVKDRIHLIPNTEPPGSQIQEVHTNPNFFIGSYGYSTHYTYRLKGENKKDGKVYVPKFTIVKDGYLPYEFPGQWVVPTGGSWMTISIVPGVLTKSAPGQRDYFFKTEKIYLKKDLTYRGSTINLNKVKLEVNSEPPGARVYEKGRLIGTTPFIITYSLKPKHYETGVMLVAPLLAAKEGWIPREHKLKFEIASEWRYLTERIFEEGTVFLLESDPNYKPPPQPIVIQQKEQVTQNQYGTQRHHLTIKKEDSFLDEALKFMQVMSIGQTLRPVLKP